MTTLLRRRRYHEPRRDDWIIAGLVAVMTVLGMLFVLIVYLAERQYG
jgi:hypothetical protein